MRRGSLVHGAAEMITLEGVTKCFSGPGRRVTRAVDKVTLKVEAGETVALIGPSGCGKSTTLGLINRLVEPTQGRVCFQGLSVGEWDPIRLRRSIGYVIQRGGLLPHLTVRRNVGLLCEIEKWSAERTRERVDHLLELVSLEPDRYADCFPGELSGGQRQRVGVARALSLDPPCILMDEPFGALDPISRRQLQAEFAKLRQDMGKTIVLVTHDMAEAFKLADRVGLMDTGRLVQVGKEVDFRQRPRHPLVAGFMQDHFPASSVR